jgi:LPS export ABC transporter protein LptC
MPQTVPPPGAEHSMSGVQIVESIGNKRDWELQAKAAAGYQNKLIWDFEEIKVIFYSEKGTTFTVTGQKGFVDSQTKNMRIEGHVRTVSSNGYEFTSEKVQYNAATRELNSPGQVLMLSPVDSKSHRMRLGGEGMHAALADSKMVIQNKVSADRTLADGRLLKITSDRAEFSGESNSARFQGNVVMEVDSMRLQGPDAVFKYPKGSDLLQSVDVQGGVRVNDVDKWATSEKVRIDFPENKVVFQGHPRVVQNNDEIVGEEIVFLNGGKKVKVQNVNANLQKGEAE